MYDTSKQKYMSVINIIDICGTKERKNIDLKTLQSQSSSLLCHTIKNIALLSGTSELHTHICVYVYFIDICGTRQNALTSKHQITETNLTQYWEETYQN
jgi:hypothetical protein